MLALLLPCQSHRKCQWLRPGWHLCSNTSNRVQVEHSVKLAINMTIKILIVTTTHGCGECDLNLSYYLAESIVLGHHAQCTRRLLKIDLKSLNHSLKEERFASFMVGTTLKHPSRE
jgi:hypothetical protein